MKKIFCNDQKLFKFFNAIGAVNKFFNFKERISKEKISKSKPKANSSNIKV
jgi:hypothetical protein